ncbi:hypothetical protein EYR38_001270 [Pleurotus pulmonarius]|nr:hypothetical protein EYR38_001743 [Pleurotus pulmonarius]KAF4607210.1 hypothetical protein EYR38_001270 [Pleurotus pulmonarius]
MMSKSDSATLFVQIGIPSNGPTSEMPPCAPGTEHFPVIVQASGLKLASDVQKMNDLILSIGPRIKRSQLLAFLTSTRARRIAIEHDKWYPLAKGDGELRNMIFANYRDLPSSVKESPRDKAHRVVFRLTWTLADAIVFLILSNDGGNPKDQQDRGHPILSEDAADVLRSAIRDARRRAKEEEEILLPAVGAKQSRLLPQLHSVLAPVDEANIFQKPVGQTPSTTVKYSRRISDIAAGTLVPCSDSPRSTKSADGHGGLLRHEGRTNKGPLLKRGNDESACRSSTKYSTAPSGPSSSQSSRDDTTLVPPIPSSTTAPHYIVRDLDSQLQFIYNPIDPPVYRNVRTNDLATLFFRRSGYTERAVVEMLRVRATSHSAEEFAQVMVNRGECFCFSEMLLAYELMASIPML